jgi:PhnB protein
LYAEDNVAEANVFDTKSVKLELQPGKYKWCACGHSKNQPWCDGSHRGSEFAPVEFVIEETRTASMCLCKQSKNRPFCDGSHKPLREAAMAKAMPAQYRGVLPYLCCRGAAKAIEWYKAAFGAVEVSRLTDPSGIIGHAEMKIGDSLFMLADEFPDFGVHSPQKFGGTPVRLSLHVFDADAFCKKAVDAGATLLRPVEQQFYGDRSGAIQDPFGHIWSISTHVEDVTSAEMQRRYDEMTKVKS